MPGYVTTCVHADRVEVVDERSGYVRVNFITDQSRISLDLPSDMAADLRAQLNARAEGSAS